MEDKEKKTKTTATWYQLALQLEPLFRQAFTFLVSLKPYMDVAVAKGKEIKSQLEPYHLERYADIFCGIILLFFGGCFANLVAATTAFRLVAWDKTKTSFGVIQQNIARGLEASAKDDEVDADHDGVKDVEQMTDKEWAQHKMLVAAKSVHPVELNKALGEVATGKKKEKEKR